MFDRLVVVGMGLLGGSVVKAARHFNVAKEIVGIDPYIEGMLPKAAPFLTAHHTQLEPQHLQDADCIVLASPVHSIVETIKKLSEWPFQPQLLITDVGSVKQVMIEAASPSLSQNYVPAHPIAGSEAVGFEASVHDLFVGQDVVLVPTPENNAAILEKAMIFWERMGGVTQQMSAQLHDKTYALTSHLPHFLAYMVHHMVGQNAMYKKCCGAGYEDFSRIAKSSPMMWTQIFLENPYFLDVLNHFSQHLSDIKKMIEENDEVSLQNFLTQARKEKNEVNS